MLWTWGLAKYIRLFKNSNFFVELKAIKHDWKQLILVHTDDHEESSISPNYLV